jgi:glc operon protein GlcG
MFRAMVQVCLSVPVLLTPVAIAQEPTPYGTAISLDQARKIMVAAEAEAKKQQWPVAIAVVDSAGFLVLFQRLDNTQLGSVEVAQQKAKTAVMYRRPTKAFEDRLAQGGADLKLLKLPGLPLEGGIPIVHEGKIIGGIGVSGVQSNQDAQVALAGLTALK